MIIHILICSSHKPGEADGIFMVVVIVNNFFNGLFAYHYRHLKAIGSLYLKRHTFSVAFLCRIILFPILFENSGQMPKSF